MAAANNNGPVPGGQRWEGHPDFVDFNIWATSERMGNPNYFTQLTLEELTDMMPNNWYFKPETLESIVRTNRQEEFLKTVLTRIASADYWEQNLPRKCIIQHNAVRVTDTTIEVVTCRRIYGTCPYCYTAGPVGVSCHNCLDKEGRFLQIYARNPNNKGSPVHQAVMLNRKPLFLGDEVAGGTLVSIDDDEELVGQYNPAIFIAHMYRAGSEALYFDEDARNSNMALAIGVADADIPAILHSYEEQCERARELLSEQKEEKEEKENEDD